MWATMLLFHPINLLLTHSLSKLNFCRMVRFCTGRQLDGIRHRGPSFVPSLMQIIFWPISNLTPYNRGALKIRRLFEESDTAGASHKWWIWDTIGLTVSLKIVDSTLVYLILDQSVQEPPAITSQSCQASDSHCRTMFHRLDQVCE